MCLSIEEVIFNMFDCRSKLKDSTIRQVLIDRFGNVGTIKDKGWFYGFKADIWQAYALGVTYYDLHLRRDEV